MTYSDEVNLRKGNVKGRKGSLSMLVILSCTGKRITFWKDLLCDRTTLKDGNTEFGVGGVEEFLRELNDYFSRRRWITKGSMVGSKQNHSRKAILHGVVWKEENGGIPIDQIKYSIFHSILMTNNLKKKEIERTRITPCSALVLLV